MKKHFLTLLSIVLVVAVLITAVPVFAAGTAYETDPAYIQEWSVSEKISTGNQSEYTIKVFLKTNYPVGPVQFKLTGIDSLVKVTLGGDFYNKAIITAGKTGLVSIIPDTSTTISSKSMNGCVAEVTYISASGEQALIEYSPKQATNPQGTLMAARCTETTVNASDFVVGQAAIVNNSLEVSKPEYEKYQSHVVTNYQSKNDSKQKVYFNKLANALDGSDGLPDMCVPGLERELAMIPQGLGFCEKWNCVFISSYYKLTEDDKVKKPSTLYTLDFDTGEITGAYALYYNSGTSETTITGHVGGVACYGDYVYVADGNFIYRFALSDFDKDSKKAVSTVQYNVGTKMNKANCAYVTITDGILWTGNFYDVKDYPTKASDSNNSVILGYQLTDNAITSVLPTYKINVPNTINHIQCATVYNNKLYISQSYGRGKDSKLIYVNLKLNQTTSFSLYDTESINTLPMMEGFFIKDNSLYTVFESASNFYMNNVDGEGYSKNPTDVIWKINLTNIVSSGNGYFSLNSNGKIDANKIVATQTFTSAPEELLTTAESCTVEATPSFNNKYYGTGSIIKVLDDNSNIIEEYELIVQGDGNGDSVVDVLDAMFVMIHATNSNGEVITTYDLAVDLAENGCIDMNDYSAIVNYALMQAAENISN